MHRITENTTHIDIPFFEKIYINTLKNLYPDSHTESVVSALVWIHHQHVLLEYTQVAHKISMTKGTKYCQIIGIPRTLED